MPDGRLSLFPLSACLQPNFTAWRPVLTHACPAVEQRGRNAWFPGRGAARFRAAPPRDPTHANRDPLWAHDQQPSRAARAVAAEFNLTLQRQVITLSFCSYVLIL